ncbi:unnamed protein product, partial [Brassica oleracea]
LLSFALTLAGEEGSFPVVLAEEATSIAIRCLSQNVYCFDHWDKLYTDNLVASVALLKKLVDDDHFFRLPSDALLTVIVNQTMESFRRKNKRAIIAEGGANCSLYKEADEYCTLISKSLSRGSGRSKLRHITAAAAALDILEKENSIYFDEAFSICI